VQWDDNGAYEARVHKEGWKVVKAGDCVGVQHEEGYTSVEGYYTQNLLA